MIVRIKDKLSGDIDLIQTVLEDIGCYNIKFTNDKFRFGKNEEGSGTGNSLNIDTLSYTSFSSNTKGDILVLVGEMLGLDLGRTIKWLADKLNLKMEYTKRDIVKPFGGFWNNLSKIKRLDDTPPITYPISILDDYGKSCTKLFYDDNIDCNTQKIFDIGYCHFSDRITIPWFDVDGSLCGVIGRENKYQVVSNFKYLALLPINKSKLLFGLNINYKGILNNGRCYVFESEKSTMQLYSYGLECGVSIGCKTISDAQARILKSLYCDIILCFDEGVTEEEIKKECQKVKIKNPFFTNRVGYIYDKDELYLKRGSKCSPSDNGCDVFLKLEEECLIWI